MPRFLLVLMLIFSIPVLADTPVGPMNYQGRLLDNNGIPVIGSYDFDVRVYDALSGGTLKYYEQHTNVAVDDGVYAFLVGTQPKLGGDSTWSVELWNCCTNLFLEISVNGETLSPRHRLAAAPYAFQANLALTTNNALALGGQSAGNILQDICTAGKGKWLEIVQKCLGVGASFPGPTQVDVNTLTASTDFTYLDLTNADISGINFGAVDFTGTLLKNTVIQGGIFTGANFANTIWDGVTTTSAVAVNFDLSHAKLKNMNLALFSFSDVTKMQYISAAYLSACPAALPGGGNWACRVQLTSPGTVYHLAGYGWDTGFAYTGVNYSRDSAMADDTQGVARLKVDNFNNANVFNADFRGMYIDQTFVGANYGNADFSNAEIWRVDFAPAGGGDGSKFDRAQLHFVNFSDPAMSLYMTSSSFIGATLDNVSLRGVVLEGVSFQNVTMFNSDFSRYDDNGAGVDFTGASIYNSKFWSINQMAGDFTNAKFYGKGPGSLPVFWKSIINYMIFVGVTFTDMVFDNNVTMINTNFSNSKWINPTFNNVNAAGTNFFGARFYELQPGALNGITNWTGATCPDGYVIPNPDVGGESCADHLLP